jgi:hypothetical protein
LGDIAENDGHRKKKHCLLDRQELTQYGHGDKRHADADNPFDHAAKHERDNDPEYFGHIERMKASAENTVSEIDLGRRVNEDAACEMPWPLAK